MNSSAKLDKAIQAAVNYVTNAKRYTIACKIIDNLLKELKTFLSNLNKYQSELEISIHELEYNKKENKRLKKIIELHGDFYNYSIEELQLLDSIKDRSQFYSSNSAQYILFKYKFIDVVLNSKMPLKETRPENIDQIEKAYKILTEQYGNPNN